MEFVFTGNLNLIHHFHFPLSSLLSPHLPLSPLPSPLLFLSFSFSFRILKLFCKCLKERMKKRLKENLDHSNKISLERAINNFHNTYMLFNLQKWTFLLLMFKYSFVHASFCHISLGRKKIGS